MWLSRHSALHVDYLFIFIYLFEILFCLEFSHFLSLAVSLSLSFLLTYILVINTFFFFWPYDTGMWDVSPNTGD